MNPKFSTALPSAAMALTLCCAGLAHAATPLATDMARPAGAEDVYIAEGVVEAVRASSIGAQLPGRLTDLRVQAGDRVRAGQVLARIDERVAVQQSLASRAQVAAAEAQLAAAQADFERQQKLHEQKFLSKAALDRAESDYKSTAAQARAQIAQAAAAGVQTGLYTLTAPYDGIVGETSVELGDMVMPGKPLMTVYDPAKMRVVVSFPQGHLAKLTSMAKAIPMNEGPLTPSLSPATGERSISSRDATSTLKQPPIRVEIPGASPPAYELPASAVTVLPTADPVSHMVLLRIALPPDVARATSQTPGRPKSGLAPSGGDSGAGFTAPESGAHLVPGMFARASLPLAGEAPIGRVTVPAASVITRSELNAVYVVAADGRAGLRQVRLGRRVGDRVEVLAGLDAGEKVALDPFAAARQR